MANPQLALPEFIGWYYGRASASQDVVEALGIVREILSGMFFRVGVIERALHEVVAFFLSDCTVPFAYRRPASRYHPRRP